MDYGWFRFFVMLVFGPPYLFYKAVAAAIYFLIQRKKRAMRLWGIYLIPRDKAPDEGFLLAYTGPGGRIMQERGSTTGRGTSPRRNRWRAWWLPQQEEVPRGPHYRANHNLIDLIDELTEDHLR